MNANELYQAIEKQSLPRIRRYETDLTLHDKRMLYTFQQEKGCIPPFLHITRESGTVLDVFYPENLLPAPGEYVPWCFGVANDREIVGQVGGLYRAFIAYKEPLLVLYFDGEKVTEVTSAKCEKLIADYHESMRPVLRERNRRSA